LLKKLYWLHSFIEKLKLPKDSLFLFGGTVRDALRGRQPRDFDLVFTGSDYFKETLSNARQYARVVVVKEQFSYMKLVPFEDDASVVDILFVKELTSFLLNRDFTINAMAVQINSSIALFCLGMKDRLIDPLNGFADLKKNLLRTCNPNSFKEDPIRILRAATYLADGEFRGLPEVYKQAAQHAVLLRSVDTERLRENILNFAFQTRPSRFFYELHRMKVDYFLFDTKFSEEKLKKVRVLEKLLQSKSLTQKQKKLLKIGFLQVLGIIEFPVFQNYFARRNRREALRLVEKVIR